MFSLCRGEQTHEAVRRGAEAQRRRRVHTHAVDAREWTCASKGTEGDAETWRDASEWTCASKGAAAERGQSVLCSHRSGGFARRRFELVLCFQAFVDGPYMRARFVLPMCP